MQKNTDNPARHDDTRAYVLVSLYAVLLILLISPDSFTHDIFTCCDTPIFFMCGKAWMNGMIPYVDFADSKGPLLWLIQGIGYLISNHTYIGVCLLQCISYSIAFVFCYKTAKLFLEDFRLALLCAMLMGFVYFNPWYHYEIKCEDWCQPFVMAAFYYLCRYFYTDRHLDDRQSCLTAYIIGICWTGPLLIKYSISIMMGIFILSFILFLILQKKNLLIPSLAFIAGVLTLFAPFALYFLAIGHFSDFIHEYFITTFATIDESNTAASYVHEILLTTADTRYAILFLSTLAGSLLISKELPRFRYFPVASVSFFWLISIHHVTNYYYLTSNFTFCILLVIYTVRACKERFLDKTRHAMTAAAVLIVMFLTFWNYTFTDGYLLSNLFFLDNTYRHTFYNAASVLSQVENPRIVYLNCAVHGWGTPVNALPGSKYYNTQYGETKEMKARKYQDISNHKPDFICMEEARLQEDALKLVAESGYKLCYDFHWWHHHFFFYTRHSNIEPPREDVKVSNTDVLLKRRIFGPITNKQ